MTTKTTLPRRVAPWPLGIDPSRNSFTVAGDEIGSPALSRTVTEISAPLPEPHSLRFPYILAAHRFSRNRDANQ